MQFLAVTNVRFANGKNKGKTDAWIAARIRTINAQKVTNTVLKRHGDDERVFPMCADAVNKVVIGMPAKEFKLVNNLPVSASTRDYLDDIQLAEIELSNLVSSKRIESNSIYGNKGCADTHGVIANRIHSAVTMRGV